MASRRSPMTASFPDDTIYVFLADANICMRIECSLRSYQRTKFNRKTRVAKPIGDCYDNAVRWSGSNLALTLIAKVVSIAPYYGKRSAVHFARTGRWHPLRHFQYHASSDETVYIELDGLVSGRRMALPCHFDEGDDLSLMMMLRKPCLRYRAQINWREIHGTSHYSTSMSLSEAGRSGSVVVSSIIDDILEGMV